MKTKVNLNNKNDVESFARKAINKIESNSNEKSSKLSKILPKVLPIALSIFSDKRKIKSIVSAILSLFVFSIIGIINSISFLISNKQFALKLLIN